MYKRLQVLLSELELTRYQQIAESSGFTLSEWVRGSLRSAASAQAEGGVDAKLAAVRAAARNDFPAPDIDQMLAEIERGYRSGPDG